MKITVESGYLVIRLKLGEPRLSKSGKSMVVASTRGPKRSKVTIRGKVIRVIASAFYDLVKPPKP